MSGFSRVRILPHQFDDFLSQPVLYRRHPEWIASTHYARQAFIKRNAYLSKMYDKFNLHPLQTEVTVDMPNHLICRKITSKFITVTPDRYNRIRLDGSSRIILRNRRPTRKLGFHTIPTVSGSDVPMTHFNSLNPASTDYYAMVRHLARGS